MATLLGAAPVGFAVLDADLRFVRVNDYLAQINGLPAAEHVGRTLREVVPGLAREAEAAFLGVLAGGEPLRELELSGEVPSVPGLRRHWTESVYPVLGQSGRPAGLAVVVFEATSRVEAEQARASTAALLDLLLMRAPIGIAFLDDELRYLRINETLAAANGIAVVDHLGRSVQEMLPEVAPDVVPLLQSVLTTGRPLIGLPVQTGPTPAEPGRRRHWSVSYYPVRHSDQNMPGGLGLIVVDDTDRVEADVERERLIEAHRTAAVTATAALQRLERLHQLTSALAAASTVDQVAATAVTLAARVLQAGAATLSAHTGSPTVSPATLRVLASTGRPAVAEVGEVLGGAQLRWAQQALAGGSAVLVPDATEADRRPGRDPVSSTGRSAWATLPLRSRDRTVGVLTFGWDTPRAFAEDVELFTAVADQCATALDRARLLDEERAARRAAEQAQVRLDVLARASEVLSGSLDEPAVLDRLAGLLVPDYTDWLVVLLADDDDRLLPCLSVHADPNQAASAAALTTTGPLMLSGGAPAARVFRTQQPLSTSDVQPYLQQTPGDVADLAAQLDIGAGTLVPMVAQGRSIGVLSLVNSPRRGPIPARDQELVLDLAARAGSALANARLFGQRSQMAQRLQASLLPDRLPDLPGLALAARYLAAEQAAEVGGDFYDAFPLTPGAHALVIGDVAGRGVDAAGLTGLARASLRALPADLDPAGSLARLNSLLLPRTGPERFVTAAYLRLQLHHDHDGDDSASDGIDGVLARAGHPPPLLLRPDGTVLPVGAPGPLLGVFDTIDPEQTRLRLDPGDVLLLYTDGVIEAHGPDGLFGDDRLAALLTQHAGHSAQQIVDAVHAGVLAYRTGGADDLALLAVQVLPPAQHHDAR